MVCLGYVYREPSGVRGLFIRSGLNACLFFKPVTMPCFYVARLGVIVVALAV